MANSIMGNPMTEWMSLISKPGWEFWVTGSIENFFFVGCWYWTWSYLHAGLDIEPFYPATDRKLRFLLCRQPCHQRPPALMIQGHWKLGVCHDAEQKLDYFHTTEIPYLTITTSYGVSIVRIWEDADRCNIGTSLYIATSPGFLDAVNCGGMTMAII